MPHVDNDYDHFHHNHDDQYNLDDYQAPTVEVNLSGEDKGKGVFSEDDDWDRDLRNQIDSDSDDMNVGSEHSPSAEE